MSWEDYMTEKRIDAEQFARISKAQNRGTMSDSRKRLYIIKLQNIYKMENQPWNIIKVDTQ